MELTTFNPYSGKFAGYNISKGKLSTELHYKVEDRKLDAQHHIVVDNLEFGDKTDSEGRGADSDQARGRAAQGPAGRDRPAAAGERQPRRSEVPPGADHLEGTARAADEDRDRPVRGARCAVRRRRRAGLRGLSGGLRRAGRNRWSSSTSSATALAERPQLRLDVPVTLLAEQDSKAIATANLYARVPPLPELSDEAALRKRLTQLEALYKTSMKIAPEYPSRDADGQEHRLERAHLLDRDASARRSAAGPTDARRVGRQRAQAVQSAVLANTAVSPERLFITTERSASLATDGRVRMELKLE